MESSVDQPTGSSKMAAESIDQIAPFRQRPPYSVNSRKRKPFRKNIKDAPPAKRMLAQFNKVPEPKISSTYILRPYFELSTSFIGVQYIANSFYNILHARDFKMTRFFTQLEFYYILLLSVYYRCALVSNNAKTSLNFELSNMKTMIKDVLLPDALATYVESFGQVKTSSDAIFIPLFRNFEDMLQLAGFINPSSLLNRVNIAREEDGLPHYASHTVWSLAPQIVVNYTQATTRALKNAIELRRVNFEEMEGRPEFLSVYEVSDGSTLSCYALDKIDHNQCQLGAAFRYRTKEQISAGGFQISPMFGAEDIEPDVRLSSHFRDSIRSKV